jgi:hypothetical protein
MRRFLIPLLATAIVVVAAAGQEPATKTKVQRLPLYWTKIGISADQKAKAATIQADFGAKIQALKEQIKNLETEESKALSDLLTPAQRTELQKLLAKKAGVETPAKDEKKP